MNTVTIQDMIARIDVVAAMPEGTVRAMWLAGESIGALIDQGVSAGEKVTERSLHTASDRSQSMINRSHRVFKQFTTELDAVRAFRASDFGQALAWINAGMPSSPVVVEPKTALKGKAAVKVATTKVESILARLTPAQRAAVIAAL